jgi:hypothetical protein
MGLRSSPIFLSLTIALGAAATGRAAPITYTSRYEADVLPTAAAGTTANPQWKPHGDVNTYAAVGDGVLTMTYAKEAANVGFWHLGTGGKPSDAWAADPDVGSTVDFRVRVESGDMPFSLGVADGNGQVALMFDPTKIVLQGKDYKNTAYTPSADHPTTDFETYRIAYKDGKVSLFAAYSDTPLVSDVLNAAVDINRLYFGEASVSFYGKYDLEYIRWTNEAAVFSAPSAPEPGMLGVLSLGGLLMLLRRRKGVR